MALAAIIHRSRLTRDEPSWWSSPDDRDDPSPRRADAATRSTPARGSERSDFRPTDEQRLLRRTLRDLVERELRPRAPEWDRSGELPWENIRRLAELGITGLTIPVAYGGGGQTLLEGVLAI